MIHNHFSDQMEAFSQWKVKLTQTITRYQQWLNDYQLSSPEVDLRIYDALEALNSDKLNIAFVAEFSRGKTELINAIFFADYGLRLLPTSPGRTTMCPTELLYDHVTNAAYIRLLPIETRLSDISMPELKKDLSHWTTLSLDINSPEQMAAAFEEIIKTKMVSVDIAEQIGLYDEEVHGSLLNNNESTSATEIEIPLWRHAIISFPHPLLKQGLVILDTPGLNALGSEPELTLNMLPSAQAILFILSADTGVTRSDLDIWQNHIMAFRSKQQSGLIAVLNKIDALWDEIKSDTDIEAAIQEQCRNSAQMLGIEEDNVFPVAAQKALVAKIKNDAELLEKSKLPALESLLGNEILPEKQSVIWDNIISSFDKIEKNIHAPITSHLQSLQEQLDELSELRGKNEDVINYLLRKTQARKVTYYKSVKDFQTSRRKLALQAKTMFNTLDLKSIDTMITKTRVIMKDSWTTGGLKEGMFNFFESARDALQIVDRQADQSYQLVQSIYKKFNEEYNLEIPAPRRFPIARYQGELTKLNFKADEFRNSMLATVSEKSFVIKNFFISLVSHAREIFFSANQEADTWMKELVNPLLNQIQEKRQQIEDQMQTLSKIKESRNNLEEKLLSLESQIASLTSQSKSLSDLHKTLLQCTPPDIEYPDKTSNTKVHNAS